MLKLKTIMATMTLSILYSIGLLGPVYHIFVVNHFPASMLDTGFLYTLFGFVTAIFQVLAEKLAYNHGKESISLTSVLLGTIC